MTKATLNGVTYNVRQGTNGKDTLVEGLGNDWIIGGAGDDKIIDLLGNNLFDGGSGSDTIIGGIGNDIFIHRMSENVGAKDRYDGAIGTDTLRLELTAAEWARADVQADIAAFLAHTATVKNKLLSLVGLTSEFTFKSMGLTISNIEKLDVHVDGFVMNTADEAIVARPDTLLTHEDAGTVSINLLANDSAPDRVASIQLLTQSQFGALTLTPSLLTSTQTAILTFTPSASMQALKAGETRSEVLTYRITDADGDVSTSTVTITVEGRNDAAVIGTPSVTFVQEDVGVADGKLKASGTISVSDIDQGQASFKTIVDAQPGAVGTLTLAADGTYTYAVDNAAVQYLGAGQTRIDSFQIESADGTQKIVSFEIRGENDGPLAIADVAGPVIETGAEPGLPIATGNVLTNDEDVDSSDTKIVSAVNGDAAKVGAPVAGTYGSLVLQADGSWTYELDETAPGTNQLAAGQTATELFNYTMSDSQYAVSSTTLAITILGANDAPIFEEASHTFALAENNAAGATVGTVRATDVDAGDTVRYAITSGNTNNWFAIDELTGRITTSHVFDFETDPRAFDLTVQARDRVTGGLTDTTSVAVAITDVAEKRVGYFTTGSAMVEAGFAADIARSGNIAVKVTSLNDLSGIDMLIYDGYYGNMSAFMSNRASILERVASGEIDLFVSEYGNNWGFYVPALGSVSVAASNPVDVNLAQGSPFTSGIGGVLTNTSLDSINSHSNYDGGAMLRSSLPANAQVVLTSTNPDAATGILLNYGQGKIVYTTMPVSAYYEFYNEYYIPATGMSNWMANVVEELTGTTNQGPGLTIVGTAMRNDLFGGAGDDRITGGGGTDTLKGGAGADRFVFNAPGESLDVVLDFSRVEGDKLEINAAGFGLSPNAAAHVQEVAALGQATGTQATFIFVTGGANAGTVYFDADGTGADPAKALVKLSGVTSLGANDILIV